MKSRGSWLHTYSTRILCVILAGGLAVLAAQAAVAKDPVPPADRKGIEAALQTKISTLTAEKNSDGVPFKRANWSRAFKKVNDATYVVTVHVDTAGTDRLTSERQLFTTKKDAAGKWSVANVEKKDSYDGLVRGVLGDEKFYAFDKLAFDREGLKVSSGPGFLMKDFLLGETSRFVIYAEGLTYDYTPPKDLDFYQVHRQVVMKEFPEDFAFKADLVRIECTPQSCKDLELTMFTNLRESGESGLPSSLSKIYQEGRKDYQEMVKASPFAAFRQPPEADRANYTVSIRRGGANEHWLWLDVDNYEPREVTFGASGRGPVYSYNSEAVRKAGISPIELERRDDMEGRNYQLNRVTGTVDLALEDPETIAGDITYGVIIKRPVREMPFQIARVRFAGGDENGKNPKMFIHSITDENGDEMTWVKTGASRGVIVFPTQQPVGQKLTIRIQFENKDSIFKLNASYSELDRGGWLPLVRFGDMIEDFDMTVRVPDRYSILGIGKKMSETVADGIRTARYKADAPVTFPTVIFGDYISAKPDVKATKIDGTPIEVTVYVDKTSTHAGLGAALPGQDQGGVGGIRGSQLKSLGDQAANALNLYREIYGVDYPYSKLDLVNAPFQAGAQAPSLIIYLGNFLFRGEGLLASATGGSSEGIAKFLKDTVAHETAHQWWGSLICMANFRNYWFVESLAEYSSALYVEALYGHKKYLEKVGEWRTELLQQSPIGSVQNSPSTWAGDVGGGSSYIANVYNKGPYAFHSLRETFGEAKFDAFLKQLAQTLKGKEIVTRDIQAVAEQSFGGNMDWFFDQWIRGVGVPQFAMTYNVRKTEDGQYLVEGKIRQRVVIGPDKTELPGVLYRGVGRFSFVFQNGKEFTYPKPMLVEKAETPFVLKVPEEPAEVIFNKDGEILAHDVLVNKSW